MLSESLLSRDVYTSEILDQEQPPSSMVCPKCQQGQGSLRCKDCISRHVLCHDCCLVVHQDTPFHLIEKWTGRFFQSTSLNQEGLVLYLGHGGVPCPGAQSMASTQGSQTGGRGQVDNERCIVVVDVSGVHQVQVSWCCCDGAPGVDIQLLRNRLFPATTTKPSTAFTFGLLNHFHIDSVECKTSALSFFSKLRRLTNDSSPDLVPVGLPAFHLYSIGLISVNRTGTES